MAEHFPFYSQTGSSDINPFIADQGPLVWCEHFHYRTEIIYVVLGQRLIVNIVQVPHRVVVVMKELAKWKVTCINDVKVRAKLKSQELWSHFRPKALDWSNAHGIWKESKPSLHLINQGEGLARPVHGLKSLVSRQPSSVNNIGRNRDVGWLAGAVIYDNGKGGYFPTRSE